MPIVVRANDPRANEKSHQIKKVLGKLCDTELSIKTMRECMDKLTELMGGMPISEQSFAKFGIASKFVNNVSNGTSILQVHVPEEYVASGITEHRDRQFVTFEINRSTNVQNLHNSDSVVVEQLKKK